MQRIYLDHAAATPVDERVFSAMLPYFAEQYANPSSIHKEGVIARRGVEDARSLLATALSVLKDEIVFTGGATESANLALLGTVEAWKKDHPNRTPHLIVSAIEHDAVFGAARALEAQGARISIAPVTASGVVDTEELNTMIEEDTVLIAVMYANNEIGTIQPIPEIAKRIRKWKKEFRGVVRSERVTGDGRYPLLYTDASQAPNYLDCRASLLGVDMMTLSSGKIYGPKGAGLLFVSRGVPFLPVFHGGGQEAGYRPGTENVPVIIGFAHAFELATAMREEENTRLLDIRTQTERLLKETFSDITINGTADRIPNNINFSFPAVDHEFLALALDARGFAVATKSACSETEAEVSHVLLALRAKGDDEGPVSGIRVSMGRQTTISDMTEFVATLSVIRSTMLLPQ